MGGGKTVKAVCNNADGLNSYEIARGKRMGISDKKTQIVWGTEEKNVCGLTLRPITMANYSEWLTHKRALIVRQSTLPAVYAFMPYLSALYALDYERHTGFMFDVIKILALSTGFPIEAFDLRVFAEEKGKLAYINVINGDKQVQITPECFPQLRSTIAELNWEKLPDEGDNPELIEAEQDILSARCGTQVDFDVNTLVASVAHQCKVSKRQLMEWTIFEFEERRACIERDKNHLICAIAEKMPMFKWAKGNPFPSWCFDAIKNGSVALESFNDFSQRTGIGGSQFPVKT